MNGVFVQQQHKFKRTVPRLEILENAADRFRVDRTKTEVFECDDGLDHTANSCKGPIFPLSLTLSCGRARTIRILYMR